jgi:hypothetical protein
MAKVIGTIANANTLIQQINFCCVHDFRLTSVLSSFSCSFAVFYNNKRESEVKYGRMKRDTSLRRSK